MHVFAWLEPEFCLRLTWTLLHFLWQGVAIAALVMLVGWSLRGAAANLRYSIHVGALVLMAVCLPIVIGVVKPVILLPAALATSLSPQQLEALLTHELAHIRRCDLLVNVLQRLIEAVLFFHPAVWYVSRRVSIEREHACDDCVVSSGWQKSDYAAALVTVAELCAASPPAGVGALAASGNRPSQFKLRIQRLMNTTDDSRLRLTRVGIASLLISLTLLVAVPSIAHSLAQDQPASADSESTDSGQPGEPEKTSDAAQPLPAESKQIDPLTLKEPAFLLPDHWIVEAVGFDNMSKELVTASKQSFVTIRRWDVVKRKLISEIKLTSDKHARPINHNTLTLSGDCRRVVAATDEYVGIWDTATGKLLHKLHTASDTCEFSDASDKPLQIDLRPDFFWNMPNVLNANGEAGESDEARSNTQFLIDALRAANTDKEGKVPTTDDPVEPRAQFQEVNIRIIGGKEKEPLRSMTVKANRELGEDTAASGQTDMNGSVALKLRAGDYYIDLQPKEEVPYLGLPIGYEGYSGHYRRWIRVNNQKENQGFTFHLADACQLTLRAVDIDTGKGIPGVTFVMENLVGEYYALPINGDNLGAKKVSSLKHEVLKTDKAGVFQRLVGPYPGWTYYVWSSPDEYEEVTRGEEVAIDTRLGTARAEYTFKFRRKPAKPKNSD